MFTQERGKKEEISLDQELGGVELTPEVFKSLSEDQRSLLGAVADKNDEMIRVLEGAEETRKGFVSQEPSLSDYSGVVADISVDTVPLRRAKITSEMQSLLVKAIGDDGLRRLGLVQRMCQRYDLSDSIRRKFR